MTTTLGSITFLDEEIQRIDSSKTCEMIVIPIPDQDSNGTEAISWGGNIKTITIGGSVHKNGPTADADAATRLNTFFSLMTSSTQSTISFSNPIHASTPINVKVQNVRCWSDVSASPVGHFNFEINLVEATSTV